MTEPICAFGVQVAVEKISSALVAYQASSVATLVKEQKSFGYWSPRRCDVYIVSYHPGYLQDRLEIAAHLWQHNISADIMYESGLVDTDHIELCAREGILCVYISLSIDVPITHVALDLLCTLALEH